MSRPDTPDRARRYGQCDDTCTVDCGHCKGAGRPEPVSSSVDGQAVETPPSSVVAGRTGLVDSTRQNRAQPVTVAGVVSGFDSLIAAPELLIEVRVAPDTAWRSWRIGDAVTLSPPVPARVDGETDPWELLRRIVMDYGADCSHEDCACSMAQARRLVEDREQSRRSS